MNMKSLSVLQHPEFGAVRSTKVKGEIWFCAQDVCDLFGNKNHNKLLQNLDEDEKGYTQMDSPYGVERLQEVVSKLS